MKANFTVVQAQRLKSISCKTNINVALPLAKSQLVIDNNRQTLYLILDCSCIRHHAATLEWSMTAMFGKAK